MTRLHWVHQATIRKRAQNFSGNMHTVASSTVHLSFWIPLWYLQTFLKIISDIIIFVDDVDLRTLRTISCQERVHKTDYSHISGQMLSQTRDILKTFYSRSQHDLHTLLRQYNLDGSVKPLNISLDMMNCSSYEDVDPPWKPCNKNMNINSRPKGHNFKQYFVHKGNGTKFISIKKT